MVYSYTQISQYLICPRRYRHRYLDGWAEKDTRAAMLFGRAFELALGAYFRREDPGDTLFREWSICKDRGLHFAGRDTWDRMLEQGIMLLTRFCQDGRVHVANPRRHLQLKVTRRIAHNDFVGYIDAIGTLDGKRCLLEWKTSSHRYAEKPIELLSLDPQLVCYSWMTGIAEVAQVVFVRKRLPEVQYLRTTISDAKREEFAELIEDTIARIESARFLPHSGVRFPQNLCSSCAYIGLCLGRPDLAMQAIVRRPGAKDLDWIDELNF